MSTLNILSVKLSQLIHKCDRYDYYYNNNNTFAYRNIPNELFNDIINHLKDNGCKSFDDIDDLIDIFKYLFYSENFDKLYDLLLYSGDKFMTTLSNNSETTPKVLYLLKQKQQDKLYDYIKKFVQPNKLAIWEERNNKPMAITSSVSSTSPVAPPAEKCSCVMC